MRTAGFLMIAALAACGGGGGPNNGTVDAPGGGSADGRNDVMEKVHFIGRFTQEANPQFAWPGSAIVTRFYGTTLTLTLDDGGQNQLDVTVDGAAQPLLTLKSGMNDYTIASGLPFAHHDVVIARRTESFFGPTTYLGFTTPDGFLESTPLPGGWIEMIGDSITCGYGVLGAGPSCSFSADTEAETHAWGQLAATQLHAWNTAIAYSGKGVYRNNGGDTTDPMPVLFERTLADTDGSTWTFSGYTPDVVVVDLGTNDFAQGDPGQPYVTAFEQFLARIRSAYPSAWILVAQSPMLSDSFPQGAMLRTINAQDLATVVANRTNSGDAKVAYLDVAEQDPNDGYGCDYHPNETTQAKMAAVLVAKIREVTGWQ